MTDAIRNRAKTLLLHDPTIDNEEIAVDLEKGIFNWCVDFCESSASVRKNSLEDFENVYSDKFKSVMINMRDNDVVREQFNRREISGRELAHYQPYDWHPDLWKQTLSERLKRRTAGVVQQNTTDLFRCGKCKERNTSYHELQIRSADEPATIFITCLNPKCKNQWRIG